MTNRASKGLVTMKGKTVKAWAKRIALILLTVMPVLFICGCGSNSGDSGFAETIAAGASHTVGLRSDGTVVATEYSSDTELFYHGECDVSDWTDIKLPADIPIDIKQADEKKDDAEQPAGTFSVADELRKLADLLDEGIITQEEFDAQKAKLLEE